MIIQIISIVVVLIIVFVVLRKQHNKEKEYFEKKVYYSKRELKILEQYKREYEPIKADERLANLEHNKWELEDIAKSATEIIFDLPIPTKTKRENLKPGDLVKLKFLTEDSGEIDIERMWVKVTGRKDGLFCGELDNDPTETREILNAGQLIWFHPNHVFKIDKK